MRNTDRDWQVIGASDPYFGVLAQSRYRGINMTGDAEREFFAEGEQDVRNFYDLIRLRIAPDFAPAHAVDFGCGIGRLAFAMAKYARVTGIDVSPTMLAEARRQAELRGMNINFRTALPNEPYDWANSYIVFQHIPPTRGYLLLGELLHGLTSGGVATIHLTTHREPPLPRRPSFPKTWRRVENNLAQKVAITRERVGTAMARVGTVTIMYDYDLARVLKIFSDNGVNGVWLSPVKHGRHHGFIIAGQKQ